MSCSWQKKWQQCVNSCSGPGNLMCILSAWLPLLWTIILRDKCSSSNFNTQGSECLERPCDQHLTADLWCTLSMFITLCWRSGSSAFTVTLLKDWNTYFRSWKRNLKSQHVFVKWTNTWIKIFKNKKEIHH